VLSREQVVASNWVGSCLLGAAVAFILWAVTGKPAAVLAAILCGLYAWSVQEILACERERTRKWLAVAAAFGAVLGGVALVWVTWWADRPFSTLALLGGALLGLSVLAGILPVMAPEVAGVLRACTPGRPRRLMGGYYVLAAVAMLAGIALAWFSEWFFPLGSRSLGAWFGGVLMVVGTLAWESASRVAEWLHRTQK
jgi:hypothetical protein